MPQNTKMKRKYRQGYCEDMDVIVFLVPHPWRKKIKDTKIHILFDLTGKAKI